MLFTINSNCFMVVLSSQRLNHSWGHYWLQLNCEPFVQPFFLDSWGALRFWIPEILLQQKMARVSSFCDPSFTLVDASPEAVPAMADPRASQEVMIEFRPCITLSQWCVFRWSHEGGLEIKNECLQSFQVTWICLIESLIRPGPLQNRDLFQSVHGKKKVGPDLQNLFTSKGAIFAAGFCVTWRCF